MELDFDIGVRDASQLFWRCFQAFSGVEVTEWEPYFAISGVCIAFYGGLYLHKKLPKKQFKTSNEPAKVVL